MYEEVCVRRVGKLCVLILRTLYTYRGFSFIYRPCDRGRIGIKAGTKLWLTLSRLMAAG